VLGVAIASPTDRESLLQVSGTSPPAPSPFSGEEGEGFRSKYLTPNTFSKPFEHLPRPPPKAHASQSKGKD